jgi:ABC-type nitrate/sulfonate/bicarbonate transport system permease component
MVKKLICGALTTASLVLQPVLAELILLAMKSPMQSLAETAIGATAAVVTGTLIGVGTLVWRQAKRPPTRRLDDDTDRA